MGKASKVISVLLRFGELACATIVLGLMSRFFYLVDLGDGPFQGRLIYAEVIAALSVFFSIVLMPPFTYSFYAFPLDFILFICNIVAFGLLADLSGSHTCSSTWFRTYWGFYWGRVWITDVDIVTSGCGSWRCILAFTFIGAFVWLISSILGVIVCIERHTQGQSTRIPTPKFLKKNRHDGMNRTPDAYVEPKGNHTV